MLRCFQLKSIGKKWFLHYTGQYVFIEASAPRKPGDRADLYSLKLDPTVPRCINFWFNMHGTNLGTLRVMVVPANNTNSSTTIWELSGQDQGTAWVNGQVAFSSKVPFYVRISCYWHYCHTKFEILISYTNFLHFQLEIVLELSDSSMFSNRYLL